MSIPDPVNDDLDVTPVEGEHRPPLGWFALFFGLIAFGAYYLWAYTPALGGWSQAGDAAGGGAGAGENILATVAFTAIPTAVAVALYWGASRRKR